jgi:formylglycine-generating enzyme required for sulfatase activity
MPRVGGRKPNDFGLFDTLGNAYEWCLGNGHGPPAGPGGPAIEDRLASRSITEAMTEPLRGGAANNAATAIGSGRRIELRPSSFYAVMGFRVARTCPPRP